MKKGGRLQLGGARKAVLRWDFSDIASVRGPVSSGGGMLKSPLNAARPQWVAKAMLVSDFIVLYRASAAKAGSVLGICCHGMLRSRHLLQRHGHESAWHM
jgi:hypothetical protein